MKTFEDSSPLVVVGFALLILLPSLDIPLKYAGIAGMFGYVVLGTAGIFVAYYYLLPRGVPKMTDRSAMMILLAGLLALAAFAVVMYPIANSGRFGGGTDVDDALIIGVNEIFAGRYPYYQKTYLGGLLSPMPGAILLAFPFVLAGLLPLQNVFWLGMLAITCRRYLRGYVPTLLCLATVLLISPTAYQVIATGSDHMANAIYILIGMWVLLKAVSDPGSSVWWKVLPAVFLGLGLSSRSNFFLAMPILFSALVQNASFAAAVRYFGVIGAVFLVVTVPFWAYDPPAFAPYLIQAGRLKNVESILPYASVIVPAVSFSLSAAFSFTRMPSDGAAMFRNCAIVQLAVLYISSLLYTAHMGVFSLFLGNVGYGMFTMFFAAASIWIYLSTNAENGS